jgi:hypothetical protein
VNRSKKDNDNILPLLFHSCGVPAPNSFAKDQAQAEPGHIDQLPLEDVIVFAQVRTPHPASVAAVRESALDQLSAPSQQALAVDALDAPPVGVHRLLLSGRAAHLRYLSAAALNVAAHLVRPYPFQHRAGVVSLSDTISSMPLRLIFGLASGCKSASRPASRSRLAQELSC